MRETEEQTKSQEQEPKRKLPAGHPRVRLLLVAALLVIVALFVVWALNIRPLEVANSALERAGLAKLPASRFDCKIGTQRRSLKSSRKNAYSVYIRFRTDQNTIAQWVRRSPGIGRPRFTSENGVGLIKKSPDWPDWYSPDKIVQGREYDIPESKVARTEVYIDDESNTVYIEVRWGELTWRMKIYYFLNRDLLKGRQEP